MQDIFQQTIAHEVLNEEAPFIPARPVGSAIAGETRLVTPAIFPQHVRVQRKNDDELTIELVTTDPGDPAYKLSKGWEQHACLARVDGKLDQKGLLVEEARYFGQDVTKSEDGPQMVIRKIGNALRMQRQLTHPDFDRKKLFSKRAPNETFVAP
ncbi:MAG: hypothetical protein K9G62_07865 [Alphaproteobacteria bacterium]|nr:hypothetical protein [Alphaproteobacteria bacterium]